MYVRWWRLSSITVLTATGLGTELCGNISQIEFGSPWSAGSHIDIGFQFHTCLFSCPDAHFIMSISCFAVLATILCVFPPVSPPLVHFMLCYLSHHTLCRPPPFPLLTPVPSFQVVVFIMSISCFAILATILCVPPPPPPPSPHPGS